MKIVALQQIKVQYYKICLINLKNHYLQSVAAGFITTITLTPIILLQFIYSHHLENFKTNSIVIKYLINCVDLIIKCCNFGFFLPILGVGWFFLILNNIINNSNLDAADNTTDNIVNDANSNLQIVYNTGGDVINHINSNAIVNNFEPNATLRANKQHKKSKSLKLIWNCGYFYGLAYFLFSIYWVGNASFYTDYSYILYPIMSLGLALFLALFFAFQVLFYAFIVQYFKKFLIYYMKLRNVQLLDITLDHKCAASSLININANNLIFLLKPLIFATIWFIFEVLRSILPFGGFPWATLAQTFHLNINLLQTMSIFGELALSFFIAYIAAILIPAILANFFNKQNAFDIKLRKINNFILVVTAGLISLGWIYGYNVRSSYDSKLESEKFHASTVAIIQLSLSNFSDKNEEFENYLQASLPNIINIWPEDIGYLIQNKNTSSLAILDNWNNIKSTKFTIISGTTIFSTRNDDQEYNISNSIIMLSNNQIVNYDKQHLVPFGEYIPLKNYLPKFISQLITPFVGDCIPGNNDILFQVKTSQGEIINFLPSICYELIFSNEIKKRILKFAQLDDNNNQFVENDKKNIDAILNVTNDSWYSYFPTNFGKIFSPGPMQHLNIARYRAIEFGLAVIRSASNGFSGIIDPCGKLIISSKIDEKCIKIEQIPKKIDTFYAKYQFIEFYFVILMIFLHMIIVAFICRYSKILDIYK